MNMTTVPSDKLKEIQAENAALKEQVAQLEADNSHAGLFYEKQLTTLQSKSDALVDALKGQVAQLGIEFTAYKRATDLAYKGSELETQEQLTALQSKSAELVDAMNKVSMLLCEANPNCSQEYLFGVITGTHTVSEAALAAFKEQS